MKVGMSEIKMEGGEVMKVGDKIWHFDINRRVYDKSGLDGRCIYREHWHQVEIKSETSRSWVTGYGKVPKKGEHFNWVFTEAEVDDDVWVKEKSHRIKEAISNCRDADVLRSVAGILNLNFKEQK